MWDYITLKSFCVSKEAINKMKMQHTEWEKISANDIRVWYSVYREDLYNSISKKTQLNNGQRVWIDCFAEKTYRWPAHTWKDRCSTSLILREVQSRSQWDITSHLSEWLLSKRQEATSVGKDVEKRETSCIVIENVNCCSHYGNSIKVPQKTKNRTTIPSSNSPFGYLY